MERSIETMTHSKGDEQCQKVYHIWLEITVHPTENVPSERKEQTGIYFTLFKSSGWKLQSCLGRELFISGGHDDKTIVCQSKGGSEVVESLCPQEEADTHIILHAIQAAKNGSLTLVICSPDTDVFVLLHASLRKNPKPRKILQHRPNRKHANNTWFIPICNSWAVPTTKTWGACHFDANLLWYRLWHSKFISWSRIRSVFRVALQKSDKYRCCQT